jgi:radical SAM protein with 4Fe4S-binding SPASM domain
MGKYEKSIQGYKEEMAARKKTLIEKLFSVLRNEVLEEILRGVSEKKARFNCTAIKKIIFIDEVGDVYPCSMIREKIGSLREHHYDIQEVIRLPETKKISEKYGIYSGCYCCWDCGIFNNIVYGPKSYPRIIKRLIAGR